VRETTLQTQRSVKKEREEVLQGRSRDFSPAAHDEDHGEAGCRPAAHGVHSGEDIHLQSLEDSMLEQIYA